MLLLIQLLQLHVHVDQTESPSGCKRTVALRIVTTPLLSQKVHSSSLIESVPKSLR